MVKLSEEQQLFVDEAKKGNNILVDACIGSGKTTAIQVLCGELPNKKKILYLTYNKLLKIDAKSKIRNRNVTVTNYHGFAFSCLMRIGVKSGISDLVQTFIRINPPIAKYDVLIIDEYQDIELELAMMLEMVKANNPDIQIVAVGDMQQKIYDKTTLKIEEFIDDFLGRHIKMEFTQCFRLSEDFAAKLGRIWNKKIVGVNQNCNVTTMNEKEVVAYLAAKDPSDILCLGARTGSLAKTLNLLEKLYPEKYNKNTVYASISESDASGSTEPREDTAIFTTFDSSKGLERKTAVIFDFTESYWTVRVTKPLQSYEILRNIFCVAASRGKEEIIFVKSDEALLSEKTLSTPLKANHKFENMEISEMFDFKYKEDIEECYSLIKTVEINKDDQLLIDICNRDGLIDLSPCIGIYQEAIYFNGYNIDDGINFHLSIDPDRKFLYSEEVRNADLQRKVLFLTSLETHQNRYREQVDIPFVLDKDKDAICKRLATVLNRDEEVQKVCKLHFSSRKNGKLIFTAFGMADVVKDDIVYELKFVSELTHEHFLQCASYVIALNLEKGILWNTRNNQKFEITIPDRNKFMNAVVRTITKGIMTKYNKPSKASTQSEDTLVEFYERRKQRK